VEHDRIQLMLISRHRKMTSTITANTLLVDFRLAQRNILRQRRRSVIAIAAIGFGVIAMMLSVGYMEWIFWANRELATVNQLGHIQVSKPGYHEDGLADPYQYLMPAHSPALRALQRLPEVRSVAPRLTFNGLVSHGDSTLSFIGEGIDPAADPSSRNLVVIEGKLLSNQDPKGIVMGVGLAANLGVKTGDSIVLLTNTASGGINAIEGTVRGLISTYMKAFDDSILRVSIEAARQLLRTKGDHLWVATLHNTDMTDQAMARLKTEPTMKGFEVVPWTRLADFYNKTVALFSRQMGVVKLIIAVIIVLSISNTMTMSVMERTVEIGTAMALGVRRQRILVLFLLEGGLLGAIGGICGVTLGYMAAQAISAVGIPMPPAPGMSRGFIAGIIVTPSIVFDALLLAVSTTLIASIYPAWRASRLVIVDALRHNR
jgi:putative ABC transport system permease protein